MHGKVVRAVRCFEVLMFNFFKVIFFVTRRKRKKKMCYSNIKMLRYP